MDTIDIRMWAIEHAILLVNTKQITYNQLFSLAEAIESWINRPPQS